MSWFQVIRELNEIKIEHSKYTDGTNSMYCLLNILVRQTKTVLILLINRRQSEITNKFLDGRRRSFGALLQTRHSCVFNFDSHIDYTLNYMMNILV